MIKHLNVKKKWDKRRNKVGKEDKLTVNIEHLADSKEVAEIQEEN